MQWFHGLSLLLLCLSLYPLLFSRKWLNVTAQDRREGRRVGLQAVGRQLVYPAVCDSALLPKAAFSHHRFLKYVCH